MKGGQGAFSATAEAAHQLEEAAGIGRDDGLGADVKEVADLAVAKLLGGLGLKEVVDACGATAKRRLGDLSNFKLRNSGEKLAGLLMDSLSVTEMACVVICDAQG